MTERLRGYLFSRRFRGERLPQHVQNLVLRDYCQRNDATYLLAAVEYRMPGCQIMLNQLVADAGDSDGIVFYSLRMLPEAADERWRLYDQILSDGRSLHFALEDMAIRSRDDIGKTEDCLLVMSLESIAVSPC